MLRLPHDMDIAQKKTSTLVKRSLNSKGTKKLAAHFLRACAVEIHMDISLPFTREFAREKWAQRAYPDLTPAFNTYGKNPQCGDTVWGKLQIYKLTLSKTNTENSPANLLTDGQYAIDVERKDPFYPVAQCTNIAQLENQCCGPKVNKTLESFWKEILLAWGFIILSHTP